MVAGNQVGNHISQDIASLAKAWDHELYAAKLNLVSA
jgi:hypothetical protein